MTCDSLIHLASLYRSVSRDKIAFIAIINSLILIALLVLSLSCSDLGYQWHPPSTEPVVPPTYTPEKNQPKIRPRCLEQPYMSSPLENYTEFSFPQEKNIVAGFLSRKQYNLTSPPIGSKWFLKIHPRWYLATLSYPHLLKNCHQVTETEVFTAMELKLRP